MSSPKTPPPPVNDPGKDLQKYVAGLKTVMPDLVGIEQANRPTFGELNLADMGNFLRGTGDTTGVLGLGTQATMGAQAELEAAKRAELQSMIGNASLAREATAAASPEAQQMVDRQTALANQRYDAAQGLNLQEKRLADQTAREAFAARGRLNDNAGVAAEILGREEVLAAKRAEAAKLGGQAFQMSSQQSQPTLSSLGGAAGSVLLGQDYLNRAGSVVGQNVPQLIDTGAGISLGQQNSANIANWQGNVAASKNASAANNTAIATGVLSALAASASYWGPALAAASDERIKTNKKRVGKTDEGLPIYTYNFLGSPKTQMGVMAQDVEKKQPDAAGPVIGGIKTVNYGKVR